MPNAEVSWVKENIGIQDAFVGASLTMLVVKFHALSAQNSGSLTAIVDVSDQNRLYKNVEYTSLGTIVPALPQITTANKSYRWDANFITIDGSGFDSFGWAYMEIALIDAENTTNQNAHILLTEKTMATYQDLASFTRTQIVVQFENLYELSVGSLYAAVRVCANVSATNYTSDYCDSCTPVKCDNSSWLYSQGNIDVTVDHVWYDLNPDLKFTEIGSVEITNPTITDNSTGLSSSSRYLTIRGTGFNSAEPVSTLNTIDFVTSRGTSLDVTGYVSEVSSAYEMIFTFYRLSACNYGELNAKATVTGGSATVNQLNFSLVATIVPSSPTITKSLDTLSSDTSLLTIKGSGFELNASLNEIQMSASSSNIPVSGLIQSSTFTHIVYSFNQLLQIHKNNTIMARIRSKCCTDITPNCVSDTITPWSDEIDVAKIVAASPSVDMSTEILNSDALKITLTGTGFSSLNNTNTVEFQNCYPGTGTCGDEVRAIEFESSRKEIVFQFTHLAPTNENGATESLFATLSVFSTWSTGSVPISVAKIVATNPTLNANAEVINSDSLTMTLKGKGFDASYPTNNVISFDPSTVEGTFVKSTLTQLILQFSSLAPNDEGTLSATLTVSDSWSISSSVQIATIKASDPTIFESTNLLYSDSDLLTIFGRGFDSGVPTNNQVTFYTDTVPSISGTVSQVSLTHLTVSFDSVLRVTNAGCLNASTIVRNASGFSITSSSSEETVAIIVEQTPTVNTRSGNLSSAATHLTIFGTGFDALSISNNEYNFYTPSDSSQVLANIMNVSWTHIIFSFTALSPTNWGCCLQVNMRTSHSNISCGNSSSSSMWSDKYNIADVYIETPIINSDSTTLYTSSRYLTIFGEGFDYVNPSVNTITFMQSSGLAVSGSVVTSTRTTFIVSFTALEHDNAGMLSAYVTIADSSIYRRRRLDELVDAVDNSNDNRNQHTIRRHQSVVGQQRRELIIADSTDGLVSETTTVATIEASAPIIDTDTVTLMKTTDTLLTIKGFGFGLEKSQQPNIVTLVPAAGNIAYTPTGRVDSSTVSALVYSFSALNPENAGSMAVNVNLNGMISNQATVVTVIPCPVVDSTTQLLDSNANEITITGRYFYAGDPSLNYVNFLVSSSTVRVCFLSLNSCIALVLLSNFVYSENTIDTTIQHIQIKGTTGYRRCVRSKFDSTNCFLLSTLTT